MNPKISKEDNPVSAQKYFLQQNKLCIKSLRTYTSKKDIESLHELRVAIKKINAVLLMLHKLQNDFDFEKNYKPYKRIFKLAGDIRTERLHQDKLSTDSNKQTGANPILVLNKKLLLAGPSFLKNSALALPGIQQSLSQIKSKKIFPYCKKLNGNLKRKWAKTTKNADIHKFRKHLKQLLYCSNLLSGKEKDKLLPPKQHRRIDKLQDTIGQWHDNILLLHKISKNNIRVSPQFLQSLHHETKQLLEKVYRKGNKL